MWIDFSKLLLCFYVCSAGGHAPYGTASAQHRSAQLFHQSITTTVPPRFRHSRFHNLDRINQELDHWIEPKFSPKLRHATRYRTTTTTTTTTTPSSDLFEEYEDDYDTDYNGDLLGDESDDEDDETYDDSDSESLFERVQTEDTTERPTPAPPAKPVSSFTDYKWKHYGTMSRVKESRTQHLSLHSSPIGNQQQIKAALDHYIRVKQEGQCKNPLPRVIQVQSEYPNPSKTYTPHCTVLHRCSEDTGCCSNTAKCTYKTRELVHLYFYSKSLGIHEPRVEKLSFYNHTECQCLKPNQTASTPYQSPRTSTFKFKSGTSMNLISHTPPQSLKRCKCPEEYEPQFRQNSECYCDCARNNMGCELMKAGNEYFSLKDRTCILNGQCGYPTCEHGFYLKQKGRCPRKSEKIESMKKLRPNSPT